MLRRLKWVFVGGLVAGLGLSWKGWEAQGLWERLDSHGKTTDGVLESGEVKKGRRGSRTYSFEVTYTPEGGAPIRQSFDVTKPFSEKVTRDDAIVEDKCVVRYDPDEPRRAIIVGGSKDARPLLSVGLGVLAVGALGTYLAFRSRPVAPAAPQPPAAP